MRVEKWLAKENHDTINKRKGNGYWESKDMYPPSIFASSVKITEEF
jgi:hypothetical protein